MRRSLKPKANRDVDLYADWCVACKEFEKYTFSDPEVQKALADTVLLQANALLTTHRRGAVKAS
ncbi:thioredoxin family protein [Shigella flexneri]